MKQIKQIMKANMAKDSFDVIYWGSPSVATFNEALQAYRCATSREKSQIQQRAHGKLQKTKAPQVLLSILYLFNVLIQAGYTIEFDSSKKLDVDFSDWQTNKNKLKVGMQSFIHLYHKFMINQSLKPFQTCNIDTQNAEMRQKNIQYCQISIKSIMQLLFNDYIVDFVIQNNHHFKNIVHLVLNSIMQRVYKDINIISKFLQANIPFITEQNNGDLKQYFRINEIYEKAIHISKQANKIENIQRKMRNNTKINLYQFNTQQNRKIEKSMLRKQTQRKQFLSQKHINQNKTKLICHEQQQLRSCPYIQIQNEQSILLCDI